MLIRVLVFTITITSWFRQSMTAPAYEVISQSTDFLGGDTVYESPKTSLTSVHVTHDQHDHSQNKKNEKPNRKTDKVFGEHQSHKQEELSKSKHEDTANKNNNYKEKDTSKQNYEKTKNNNFIKEGIGLFRSIDNKNGNAAENSRIGGIKIEAMPNSLSQFSTAAVHNNHKDCPYEQHEPIHNHIITGVNLETFPEGETNHGDEATRNLEYWINLGKEYAIRGYDQIFGDNGRLHSLNINFNPEYLD